MAKIGAGSVNRLIFPLATLALLLMVRGAVTKFHTPAFFPIAIPLVIALAAIRLSVYALRNLFGHDKPLPLSERTVGFTIWGVLLLYYLGISQEIGNDARGSRTLHRALEHQPARTGARCADRHARADDLAVGLRPDRAVDPAHAQRGPQCPRRHGQVLPRDASGHRRADLAAVARHRPHRAVGIRRRARRRHRARVCRNSRATTSPDSRSCSIARFASAT